MATTLTGNQLKSYFLDILPCELRLQIYSHLLIARVPLQGRDARDESTRYDVHTAILRTNRKIYQEANPVFFGENVFHITSSPGPLIWTDGGIGGDEGSGALEPPLQPSNLPMIHHLKIDLLYGGKQINEWNARGLQQDIQKSAGAQRYMASLAFLLESVQPSLRSIHLHAAPRHCDAYDPPHDQTETSHAITRELDADLIGPLTRSHAARTSVSFRTALSKLPLSQRTLDLGFGGDHQLAFENPKLTEECRARLANATFPQWPANASQGLVKYHRGQVVCCYGIPRAQLQQSARNWETWEGQMVGGDEELALAERCEGWMDRQSERF